MKGTTHSIAASTDPACTTAKNGCTMVQLHAAPTTTSTTSLAEPMTDKAFSTLQARFALCGQALNRLPGSGAMYATRWGMVRHLATEEEARLFLARIEGRAKP